MKLLDTSGWEEVALVAGDAATWQKARTLAVRCREGGLTVPVADIVIAASAARYRLDLEHFGRPFEQILPVAARL